MLFIYAVNVLRPGFLFILLLYLSLYLKQSLHYNKDKVVFINYFFKIKRK